MYSSPANSIEMIRIKVENNTMSIKVNSDLIMDLLTVYENAYSYCYEAENPSTQVESRMFESVEIFKKKWKKSNGNS